MPKDKVQTKSIIIRSAKILVFSSLIGITFGWILKKQIFEDKITELNDDSDELREAYNFDTRQKTGLPNKNAVDRAKKRLAEIGKKLNINNQTDKKAESYSTLKSLNFRDFEIAVSSLSKLMEDSGLQIISFSDIGRPGDRINYRKIETIGLFKNVYTTLTKLTKLENIIIRNIGIKLQPDDGYLVFNLTYSFANQMNLEK